MQYAPHGVRVVAVAPGPMAAVGYCMGGGRAINAAAAYPERIASAASFHGGRLASEAPDSPHLNVATIKGRVYVGSAGVDESVPPEQSARLAEALRRAGELADPVPYQEGGELLLITALLLVAGDPEARRRLGREVDSLRRVRHPASHVPLQHIRRPLCVTGAWTKKTATKTTPASPTCR